MNAKSGRHIRGFTLIETLVALFILSLLAVAGTGLLISALRTGSQVEAWQAEAQDLDVAQVLIRNDLAAISIRGIRPDDGFRPPGNLFGRSRTGSEPFLRFVRSGWINPGQLEARSTLQAVDYRLEEGRLIRRAALRPDTVQATPRVEQVLLEGLRAVDLRFLRGSEWSDIWDGGAGQPLEVLPDLVELTLTFETDAELRIVALTGGRS